MPKEKKVVKSKQQLIKELQDNSKFKAKMKFTREMFYPALVAASTSIDDAQNLLGSLNTMIMQEFLSDMKEKKFSDLKLEDKLDKDNPKYTEFIAMLDLFKDLNVFDAKDCIEGMRSEIELFMKDEREKRTLDTLEVKWVDQL